MEVSSSACPYDYIKHFRFRTYPSVDFIEISFFQQNDEKTLIETIKQTGFTQGRRRLLKREAVATDEGTGNYAWSHEFHLEGMKRLLLFTGRAKNYLPFRIKLLQPDEILLGMVERCLGIAQAYKIKLSVIEFTLDLRPENASLLELFKYIKNNVWVKYGTAATPEALDDLFSTTFYYTDYREKTRRKARVYIKKPLATVRLELTLDRSRLLKCGFKWPINPGALNLDIAHYFEICEINLDNYIRSIFRAGRISPHKPTPTKINIRRIRYEGLKWVMAHQYAKYACLNYTGETRPIQSIMYFSREIPWLNNKVYNYIEKVESSLLRVITFY